MQHVQRSGPRWPYRIRGRLTHEPLEGLRGVLT